MLNYNSSSPIKRHKSLNAKLWLKIIRDYETCGLSAEKFCAARQINLSTFKNWLYRFKVQQRKAVVAPTETINFAPVKIASRSKSLLASSAPLASDVDGEFKIELQSSIKIIVPSNFDDEQLLRLLNLLNSNIGINNAAAK